MGPQQTSIVVLDRLGTVVSVVGILAACLLIPAQVLISLTYVLGRKLFDVPVTALQELEWHCFFALVFLSLGAALLADRHVRIDILRTRLSERTHARIEISGFFVALLPFCLAVIYVGGQTALHAFATGEHSGAALGLPYRWVIKSTVPIGGLLLLCAGVVSTARNVYFLRTGRSVTHTRES